MGKLIGTNPNQVPSNADLGTAAFVDKNELLLAGGGELSAIDAVIDKTVRAVCIYDTSKDSDGGEWRNNCSHTSWYNEKLNTPYRGSRREFPSVAVIISDSSDNSVTVYDADDPTLPMWMKFTSKSGQFGAIFDNRSVLSLAAANGSIYWGDSFDSVIEVSLLKDDYRSTAGSGSWTSNRNVADRNPTEPINRWYNYHSSRRLISYPVTKIALRVLDGAMLDPVTKLPVPTIAVATENGASVIKDNGNVIDISYTSGDNINEIAITPEGKLILGVDFSGAAGGRYVKVLNIINSDSAEGAYTGSNTDLTVATYAPTGAPVPHLNHNDHSYYHPRGFVGTDKETNFILYPGYLYTCTGFCKWYNYQDKNNAMMSAIGADYNTGWMPGDIAFATLCDTDSSEIGWNLVSNGTFFENRVWYGNEFTISGGTCTVGSAAGNGQLTQNLDGYMQPGKAYTLRFSITAETGTPYLAFHDFATGSTSGGTYTWGYLTGNAVGDYEINFVAGNHFVNFVVGGGNSSLTFDNVSLIEAARDFSPRRGHYNKVVGTTGIKKVNVAPGAEMVAYKNFSSTNYLQQQYNTNLDFGTGDFTFACWFHAQNVGGGQYLFNRSPSTSDRALEIWLASDLKYVAFYTGGANLNTANGVYQNDKWVHLVCTRNDGRKTIYINGLPVTTHMSGADVSRSGQVSSIGENCHSQTMISMVRMSGTSMTDEAVKKMYDEEKRLFQEDAKCTLYGNDNLTYAIAYDEYQDQVHVGTGDGRSVFQNLARIDNTETATTARIDAVDGLVVED